MSRLARLGTRLVDLILPRVCAACDRAIGPDEAELCEPCAADLARLVGRPYCATCGTIARPYLLVDGRCTLCRAKKAAPLDRFVRVGPYEGALRVLVLRFKREYVLDRFLGRLLGEAIEGALDGGSVNAWVPIPSPFRRRLQRGYQPTALLARAASRLGSVPVIRALRMARYVAPFHRSMPADARAQAIRGAFRVSRLASVRGRALGLIDDVSTTGATLREACRVLRGAGATRIVAAIVAKTTLGDGRG
ncbi:MAG: ComF family protein [Phycisphaerae bacterium]